MSEKLYPESGVELRPAIARKYDRVMNIGSFGLYSKFINAAIGKMDIQPSDSILDLGCGTGRNALLMSSFLGKDGYITGLDISEHMERQFLDKFKGDHRVEFINRRIDIPFSLEKKYDKVFISFVIHGFPHEIRDQVINNAIDHLNPGGQFYILDFAEFNMNEMPALHRFIFKKIECVYAFDYIARDWKEILKNYGLGSFQEHLFMRKYVRLLKSVKNG